MNKARHISRLIILILLIALMHLPQGQAIVPDSQIISIVETHDDAFITESGNLMDAYLCHITDPNMDIVSFLVFRGIKVNWWEPLTNATLRLRTTVNLDFDADSSVTIYGMRYSDLQEISIVRPSFVLSVPLTSAYVSVNTSQFYGQQWHEVNVTDIVEELIRSYDWDGDGHDGTETGDAIGFVIFGAEGHDTRWFIDYHYGTPSLATQLVIHWNHEPPPPPDMPDDAEYVETRGNYTIWSKTPTATWFNFSTFSQYGTTPKESEISDYAFKVTNMYTDTDSYFRRDYDTHRDDSEPTINVKFGLNITTLYRSVTNAYVPVWSVSEDHDVAVDYDKGFVFTMDVRSGPLTLFRAWSLDAGAYVDSVMFGPQIDNGELPETKYFNITMNMETFSVVSKVYEDYEMTILNGTWTDTFTGGPAWAGGSWLTYEYVNARHELEGPNTGYTGWHLSKEEDLETKWYVHETGVCTVTGPFDDYNSTIDWIDTEKPDPEDPDPGGEWSEGPGGPTGPFTRFRMRFYFLVLGLGCVFGPVMFFAWRRPSGYYLFCGAIIIIIGVGLLLSIGQV